MGLSLFLEFHVCTPMYWMGLHVQFVIRCLTCSLILSTSYLPGVKTGICMTTRVGLFMIQLGWRKRSRSWRFNTSEQIYCCDATENSRWLSTASLSHDNLITVPPRLIAGFLSWNLVGLWLTFFISVCPRSKVWLCWHAHSKLYWLDWESHWQLSDSPMWSCSPVVLFTENYFPIMLRDNKRLASNLYNPQGQGCVRSGSWC